MMHLTISLMHSFGPKYTNKHMVETHNKHFVMGVSGGVLAALVTNTRKQIASRRRLPKSNDLTISGSILCYTTVDMWKGRHLFP